MSLSGKLSIFDFSLAVKTTCIVSGSISVKQPESPNPTLSSRIFPETHTGEIYDMGPYISLASDISNFQVNLLFTSRVIYLLFYSFIFITWTGERHRKTRRCVILSQMKGIKKKQTEAKPGWQQ